jgi:AraC family transcriptional regulator
LLCQLNGDSFHQWIGEDIEWNDRQLEASLDIPTDQIRSLLHRLAQETRYPGFASHLMVELIAGQISIEIARYCQSVTDSPMTGGLASWRLKLIDERLAEVCKAPSLAELATLCGLSVRQLTRGFRTSRGCSIGQHVAQSRIKLAKRLLIGSESIKSIAYAMGFSSPSSFSYAFRRATGFTPGAFRQHMRRPTH